MAHLWWAIKKSSFQAASESDLVDKWHENVHSGFEHEKKLSEFFQRIPEQVAVSCAVCDAKYVGPLVAFRHNDV